jgi:hypothetical protein
MRIGLTLSMILGLGLTALGEGPSRFVPSRFKAEWMGRRPELIRSIEEAMGLPSPEGKRATVSHDVKTHDGFLIDRIMVTGGSGQPVNAGFVRRSDARGRLPSVVLLMDGKDAAFRPGLDGQAPAFEIAKRGMGVYWIETETTPDLWTSADRWPTIVSNDQSGLRDLLGRTDVDPDKIGVVGIGLGGLRAAWLMGLSDRVGFGVAIGGMTRFADLIAARGKAYAPPSWMTRIVDGMDTETIVALCAGRVLEWTVGDADPSSPSSGVGIVESVGETMERVVSRDHTFHVTHLGRQGDRYGRLQWMGTMEILDKAFFAQGPTPLGHAPEPEPVVTPDFVDLAAHGLAGWVSEMSERPGTWTWRDGVIACKPGRDEYGWLRAPIEVGDFVLTAEWKVPERGNSGIFLRARPVPWSFPPSPANKRIVSALGLDWPSRTGLELQAQDDHGRADKYTSGSLYRHAGTAENPTHPAGEWNKFTVRCRGMRVEVWSNGKQILDTMIDECPLTLPNPPARGYIGLQNHGSPGEFRKIKLRRL